MALGSYMGEMVGYRAIVGEIESRRGILYPLSAAGAGQGVLSAVKRTLKLV